MPPTTRSSPSRVRRTVRCPRRGATARAGAGPVRRIFLAELDRPQRRRTLAARGQRGQRRAVALRGGARTGSAHRPRRFGSQSADDVAIAAASPTCSTMPPRIWWVSGSTTPLVGLDASARALSADDADPAQVAFSRDGRTLAVTERGTDSVSAYAIGDGYTDGPRRSAPRADALRLRLHRGRDDDRHRAFRGTIGAAATSSYSLTVPGKLASVHGSVGDSRSEVCWATVTNDGHFAYVTNSATDDLELRD